MTAPFSFLAAWPIACALVFLLAVLSARREQLVRTYYDLIEVVAGRRTLGDVRWGRS